MKISILGSCVTWDVIERLPAGHEFELVERFGHSCLASAMSSVPATNVRIGPIGSALQRRMVEYDLTGGFLDALEAAEFDVLVYDPMDERFDLLEFDSRARATVSDELRAAGFEERASGRLVQSRTDEAFILWESAWFELIGRMAAAGTLRRLRVNRVFWSETVDQGGVFPEPFPAVEVDLANRYLRRLYDVVDRTLPADQIYSYGPGDLVAAAEHQRGVSPFHYTDRYYELAVRHLRGEAARPAASAQPIGSEADRAPALPEFDGFVHSPAPLVDFLAYQLADTAAETTAEALRAVAAKTGLHLSRLDTTLILSQQPVSLGQAIVSGLVVGATSEDPLTFDDCAGQFTALIPTKDRVVAFTDCFGMGSIFTYVGTHGVLVSNRLHLAAAVAREVEERVALNTPRIAASVLDYMMFAMQSFTHEMPMTGLERVPIGSRVALMDGRLQLEDTPPLLDRHPDRSYEDLLASAEVELSEYIAATVQAFPDRDVVVDVTGGIDSRLVLAAWLKVSDTKPLANTNDVPGSDDLALSLTICSRFGLDYWPNIPVAPVAITYAEALRSWRSFLMGEYNVLGLPAVSNVGISDVVRITGGAGEIHRDFWNKIVAGNLGADMPDTITDVIDALLRTRNPYLAKLPEDLQRQLRAYVIAQFEAFADLTVSAALNQHYLMFRNRLHFGFRGWTPLHDTFQSMPLLSRSLYEASMRLSASDRNKGLALKDLTRRFNPELADLPYDGEGVTVTAADLPEKHDAWNEALLARQRARRAVRRSGPDVALVRRVEIETAHALARLRRTAPELDAILDTLSSSFQAKRTGFESKRSKSPRDALIVASKVLGLDDALHPLTSHKVAVDVGRKDYGRYLNPIAGVTVTRDGSQLTATIGLHDDIDPDDYQFAFYFYANGERIGAQWYTAATSAAQRCEPTEAMRVLVFVQHLATEAKFTMEKELEPDGRSVEQTSEDRADRPTSSRRIASTLRTAITAFRRRGSRSASR